MQIIRLRLGTFLFSKSQNRNHITNAVVCILRAGTCTQMQLYNLHCFSKFLVQVHDSKLKTNIAH